MQNATFLSQYAHIMESYETPEIYDLWAAMATLASVVSRRVWFDLGTNIRIFPNLYVVLVGPPGARKNTAMNTSQELLEALGDVPMIQGAKTKEQLVSFMVKECNRTFFDVEQKMEVEYSPLTIFSNELTHFLGTDAMKAIHMVDFLTIMYDKVGDYDVGTISRGEELVPKPCLNLFSATTPSNISRYLKEEVLLGGMARRTVFVNAHRVKRPIALPTVTEASIRSKAWCLTWLTEAAKVSGAFTLSEEAKQWYIPWYNQVFEQVAAEHNDLIGGYLSSKHIQMFKLAMLSALNRDLTKLVLTVDDCLIADALLTKIEAELPIVYEGLGVNEQAAVARRVVDAVRAAGGKLADKEIRSIFFKDSKDLPRIMEHLQETQQLLCMATQNPDGTTRSRQWLLPQHPDVLRAKATASPAGAPTPVSAASNSPAPLPVEVHLHVSAPQVEITHSTSATPDLS